MAPPAQSSGTSSAIQEIPRTALAIYAHPDDPFISCAGTLALWAEASCNVEIVICTEGEKGSHSTSADPQELAAVRKKEAERSAEVIGCNTPRLLGYPDGEIENNLDLVSKLVRCIREVQPEVVFCPDPTAIVFGEEYINHRDHRIIGMATLDALAPAAAMPLYFPEAGKPHQVDYAYLSGTLEPSIWIDITASIARKVASIECQKSQVDGTEWIGDLIRERARGEGQKVGVSFAESFRRVHTGA
ncbi:MAG: PIG-L family deacetylase [Actinobacteria bacterium]|nr:PIG-L family deacetylase [Actinomycetota bacterium]MCL5446363.1 PIG-L family deacetylase [Actinomycetota bacterium]